MQLKKIFIIYNNALYSISKNIVFGAQRRYGKCGHVRGGAAIKVPIHEAID